MKARLLVLLVLLMPSLAHAADGDRITARDANLDTWRKRVAYLCNGKDTADTACTEVDLNAIGLFGANWYVLQIDTTTAENATACTGSISVRNYDVAGGVGTTALKPSLATLTIGTTEIVRIEGPIKRYLDVGLGSLATCTAGNDNLDVVIDAYFERQ